ncbi:MAG: GNAT family N-acetyltransferase [Thermoguttaceae bacterium]|nr:GNAT family N-acetyltransferase [Thermoguttaceae bacterium]
MEPRPDPRAEGSTFHCLPQAAITKTGEAILIRTLDDKTCQGLIDMYLAYQPRNSFQGLPPVSDAACVQWVQHMIGHGINLVALSFGEGAVGHAALFPIDDQRCEFLVVVAPRFQNIGIGTHLTRCAVQLAYEIGFDTIWLPVERTNLRARHVYKKCGFEYLATEDPRELEMTLDLAGYHEAVSIPVETMMNRNVLSIGLHESCRTAVEVFLKCRVASLPVVDDQARLIGIISETDMMLPSNLDKCVADVLTRDVLFVRPTCTVAKVVRMFLSKKVRSIPVVDAHGRLVGIIGRRDVLTYYVGRL